MEFQRPESYNESIPLAHSYFQECLPYLGALIALEYVVLMLLGKPTPRINETATSLGIGLLQECFKVAMRGFEMVLYVNVYNRFRLIDLPSNSEWSWCFTALMVDFGYYWVHRANHEINILWSIHQVHHSSEELNLAVGLRHGVLNTLISWIAYTPLALLVPPTQFFIHLQLNVLYQFLLHTEAIDTLGPLEWVLNTPNHHRLHHGSNKYVLDKNYGGVLIIWDRLFGTFQSKEPESTVYGLVFPIEIFNPIKLQIHYFPALWNRLKTLPNFKNKIEAIFKGPSWTPGSPWTGFAELKPNGPDQKRFQADLPDWISCYVIVHFTATAVLFNQVISNVQFEGATSLETSIFIGFIIVSVASFGCLLDGRLSATYCFLELLRCITIVMITSMSDLHSFWKPTAPAIYLFSAVVWSFKLLAEL